MLGDKMSECHVDSSSLFLLFLVINGAFTLGNCQFDDQ